MFIKSKKRDNLISTLIFICIILTYDCRKYSYVTNDNYTKTGGAQYSSFSAVLKKIPNAPVPDSVSGTAELIISGNNLTIKVSAKGLTPDMHPMHLHVRTDGTESKCPTSKNDSNGDGFIDHVEADTVSGLIHVPLTENPLDFSSISFPHANNQGILLYEITVPLDKMKKMIMSKENKKVFDPGNYNVEVHGCDSSVKLPASVSTMDNMPAYMTIPVLCGKLDKNNNK